MVKLREAVDQYQSPFCCRGSIPTSNQFNKHSGTALEIPIQALPVSLRWDLPDHTGHARTIQFPLASPTEETPVFEELLQTCAPATFGIEGKDVLLLCAYLILSVVGGIIKSNPTAAPKLFPLYKVAKTILTGPEFFEEGGHFGFWCSHPYAHASENSKGLMPYALKGIDVTVFSVVKLLGLEELMDRWPHDKFSGIKWLNSPSEVGITNETFGGRSSNKFGKGWGVALVYIVTLLS
ncbi:hypothetical protein B0J14DRAFT_569047 [Halenospora varia]|nr:hypothetical protein B0J14DRAFT_569047 [Halenospora varia]